MFSGVLLALALLPSPREFVPAAGHVREPSVSVTRDASLPPEGYSLEVTQSGVRIAAADDAGVFYARQTLEQLSGPQGVRCCRVRDWPEYPYRGVMIDDGRHFFGKAHILKTLEWMAKYKLNKFHWHLCEDQGWRIQIDGYPNLTTIGATRPRSPLPGRYTRAYDNRRYGPFFYTKDDIREVVARAEELHIEIIPDLEMPGHARSVIASYPQLGCPTSPLDERTAWTDWGICDDVFCLGNEQVYRFWCDVIDEVCELFPSSRINMCGDECTTRNWSKCPKCRAKAEELGLEHISHLQGWMTNRIVAYLRSKGRYYMGYADGMGHGSSLGTGDVVAIAGSQTGGAEAAARGYKVVMAPVEYAYWDFNQGLAGDPYVYASWWSGSNPLGQVYSFQPRLGLSAGAAKNVIGGLAFNWSEYTATPAELEWKMWPRAIAFAQALWNPPSGYSYAERFLPALSGHLKRLRAAGVNCATWAPESPRACTGGMSADNQVMKVAE